MRISVLGLGRMGAPMARNLAEVGHEVTLYSRNPERARELAASGGKAATTIRAAVKDAQVALTMVTDDEAERAVTYGPEGLLARLPAGAIHLCMSTIGVETSRNLALAHAEAGQGYVAAPVFGRPGAAASRQLWIMAGGPEPQVARCAAIFEVLAKGTTRVGPRAELAHALKLGGSMLTALMVEGLSEVLAYGEKAGMEPAEYLRLLNTAIFRSPMMDAFGGLVVRRSYDPADLPLEATLRDMRRAMEAAEDLDAVMPAAEWLHQRLEESAARGWGAQDLTVLSRRCRQAAGLDEEDSGRTAQDSGVRQAASFRASAPEGDVELDLHQVTHFELIKDAVWAWSEGRRYCTSWRYLAEVEQSFQHTPFLKLHRHILLQPEAALARKSGKGNAAKADPPTFQEPMRPVLRGRPPRSSRGVEGLQATTEEQPAEGWVQDPLGEEGPDRSILEEGRDKVKSLFQRVSFPRVRPASPVPPRSEEALESVAAPVPAAPPKPPALVRKAGSARSAEVRPRSTAPVEEARSQGPGLEEITHFEAAAGVVWAWVQGARVRTPWNNLDEIEAAFTQVVLVRIQRSVLLNPEAVLAMKPVFGGRSKVTVAGQVELGVSRSATRRLKEVLGF